MILLMSAAASAVKLKEQPRDKGQYITTDSPNPKEHTFTERSKSFFFFITYKIMSPVDQHLLPRTICLREFYCNGKTLRFLNAFLFIQPYLIEGPRYLFQLFFFTTFTVQSLCLTSYDM